MRERANFAPAKNKANLSSPACSVPVWAFVETQDFASLRHYAPDERNTSQRPCEGNQIVQNKANFQKAQVKVKGFAGKEL